MISLEVSWQDQIRELSPGDELTFGRDATCTLVLDPDDRGLSRRFGRIHESEGTWWLANVSEKRSLHVVYETGLSEPLPVAGEGWPAARRSIDGPMRVLVPGFAWTHEIRLVPQGASAGVGTGRVDQDGPSTISQLPPMTDNRREALVALASGYLRPFPRYDPRPLTYGEAAELLGVRQPQVRKRIEVVRSALVDAGVARLEQDDARRELVEWALSMRVVGPSDLEWLERRVLQRAAPPIAT